METKQHTTPEDSRDKNGNAHAHTAHHGVCVPPITMATTGLTDPDQGCIKLKPLFC